MRLTLRTLLAYLDNTLEPADAEILRKKLGESGFATQLVQRIRKNLVDPALPAPPPEAVGPVHDANVIGEFLDSVLPEEQVSEIERACLELDPNLAEAAACHQILTMVLGKPADVPPSLRDRIYQLPDHEIEKIAASSDRFSSLSMDDPTPPDSLFSEKIVDSLELPSIESAETQSPLTGEAAGGPSVSPVGLSDSGVFDAPTRLRESGVLDPEQVGMVKGPSAIAGDSPRSTPSPSTEDRIYGESVRPYRLTASLLISLALAAVLFVAMIQIFQPLFGEKVAKDDLGNDIPTDVIVPADEAPRMIEVLPDSPAKRQVETIVSPGDIALPEGIPEDAMESAELLPPPSMEMDLPLADALQTDALQTDALQADAPADNVGTDEVGMDEVDTDDDFIDMSPPKPTATKKLPVAEDLPEMAAETSPAPSDKDVASDRESMTEDDPPTAADLTVPEERSSLITANSIAATVDGEGKMVLSLDADGQWSRMGDGGEATAGMPIICAPKFRAVMQPTEGPRLEMIGPSGVRWLGLDEDTFGLEMEFGRLLITSKKPETTLALKLGGQPMELTFDSEESIAAASIKYFRSPGQDPGDPGNRIELIGVLTAQGNVTLTQSGESIDLSTGEQWIKRGDDQPTISPVKKVPAWISGIEPPGASLDQSARDGLLKLTSKDGSIERSLREATLFRRSEVAALAAQTLLFMGQSDAYFGGGGILSESKQRQYWPDHFKALVANLDRSPESASLVRQAMAKMDAAHAKTLYRLLVGFSEEQLAQGGDEELVQWLDSDSMAVRVLALENLHEITGTTLYFRAETDNRVRRSSGIKKWTIRQEKGDIRWDAQE